MAWTLHRSAIAACLVYFREIDPTAFWEFCNTIRDVSGHGREGCSFTIKNSLTLQLQPAMD
jgi:hypothetical protein